MANAKPALADVQGCLDNTWKNFQAQNEEFKRQRPLVEQNECFKAAARRSESVKLLWGPGKGPKTQCKDPDCPDSHLKALLKEIREQQGQNLLASVDLSKVMTMGKEEQQEAVDMASHRLCEQAQMIKGAANQFERTPTLITESATLIDHTLKNFQPVTAEDKKCDKEEYVRLRSLLVSLYKIGHWRIQTLTGGKEKNPFRNGGMVCIEDEADQLQKLVDPKYKGSFCSHRVRANEFLGDPKQ